MNDWSTAPSGDAPPGPLGWALALVRFVLIALVIYGLMIVLFVTRLFEQPFGQHRLSPFIVQLACKASLRVMGLRVRVSGEAMAHCGALVANHSSWLDIFVLNAAARVFFVSKVEVSKWPLIGLIARATGTVFIARNPRDAKVQKAQFERRLMQGDRLLFFPEGTSTDSRRVMRFKSTLFAAFFSPPLRKTQWIQPVSVLYTAPKGADPRYYGWWGEMAFAPHFLKVLGARRAGRIEVVFHSPVRVADYPDRKALAAYCEARTRAPMAAHYAASAS